MLGDRVSQAVCSSLKVAPAARWSASHWSKRCRTTSPKGVSGWSGSMVWRTMDTMSTSCRPRPVHLVAFEGLVGLPEALGRFAERRAMDGLGEGLDLLEAQAVGVPAGVEQLQGSDLVTISLDPLPEGLDAALGAGERGASYPASRTSSRLASSMVCSLAVFISRIRLRKAAFMIG